MEISGVVSREALRTAGGDGGLRVDSGWGGVCGRAL